MRGARLSAALAPGATRSVLEGDRFDASHQRLDGVQRRRGGAGVLAGSATGGDGSGKVLRGAAVGSVQPAGSCSGSKCRSAQIGRASCRERV